MIVDAEGSPLDGLEPEDMPYVNEINRLAEKIAALISEMETDRRERRKYRRMYERYCRMYEYDYQTTNVRD